ncbi:MAG: tetratricopeptide repeat protein, partial [Candidatus Electrothrix sp. MAN1_4]|nr:tetratricopeptide repeat protein [Candidatus Electrothrix sp. MAN1_4]
AVHAALQTDRGDEGVDFADSVNRCLFVFGLRRDSEKLTEAAGKAGNAIGSQAWFLSQSNKGEQLRGNGQPAAAAQIFADILTGLEETPNHNRCLTLGRLGRCSQAQGQPTQAEDLYQQALAEIIQLKQSEQVRRQTGAFQTDLADVLADQGKYSQAKAAYQASLDIKAEIDDVRGRAVVTGQLGTLAWRRGELAEAEERYKEALSLFQRINEPVMEAVAWHQLGVVYQQAKQWEAAEQAYRQAARLKEEQGMLGGMNGAGTDWNQLAQVCKATGRLPEAEQWYGKALKVRRATNDRPGMAITLNNLASLLADDPARSDEARAYAEEGVVISETLDPAAMQIWTTYNLLARIATKQGENSQAAAYRAKSRQVYLAFPAWRQGLLEHEKLIAAVVQGGDVEAALAPYNDTWANLKAAIQCILNGERNEATLSEPLDWQDAAVIHAILEGIDETR